MQLRHKDNDIHLYSAIHASRLG